MDRNTLWIIIGGIMLLSIVFQVMAMINWWSIIGTPWQNWRIPWEIIWEIPIELAYRVIDLIRKIRKQSVP